MTDRWDCRAGKRIESPPEVEMFLDDIEAVCKKHGISISHEDGHGAFELTKFNQSDIEWLRCANLDADYPANKSDADK